SWSPRAAWSKASSKASVKRLIAETTTTGREARSRATREATRSNALASSTDVPPNFITVVCVVVISLTAVAVRAHGARAPAVDSRVEIWVQPKNTKAKGKRQTAPWKAKVKRQKAKEREIENSASFIGKNERCAVFRRQRRMRSSPF